eukprot:SAG11_NODE_33625_length_276_cov_0.587571_1_plen_49_part_10
MGNKWWRIKKPGESDARAGWISMRALRGARGVPAVGEGSLSLGEHAGAT